MLEQIIVIAVLATLLKFSKQQNCYVTTPAEFLCVQNPNIQLIEINVLSITISQNFTRPESSLPLRIVGGELIFTSGISLEIERNSEVTLSNEVNLGGLNSIIAHGKLKFVNAVVTGDNDRRIEVSGEGSVLEMVNSSFSDAASGGSIFYLKNVSSLKILENNVFDGVSINCEGEFSSQVAAITIFSDVTLDGSCVIPIVSDKIGVNINANTTISTLEISSILYNSTGILISSGTVQIKTLNLPNVMGKGLDMKGENINIGTVSFGANVASAGKLGDIYGGDVMFVNSNFHLDGKGLDVSGTTNFEIEGSGNCTGEYIIYTNSNSTVLNMRLVSFLGENSTGVLVDKVKRISATSTEFRGDGDGIKCNTELCEMDSFDSDCLKFTSSSLNVVGNFYLPEIQDSYVGISLIDSYIDFEDKITIEGVSDSSGIGISLQSGVSSMNEIEFGNIEDGKGIRIVSDYLVFGGKIIFGDIDGGVGIEFMSSDEINLKALEFGSIISGEGIKILDGSCTFEENVKIEQINDLATAFYIDGSSNFSYMVNTTIVNYVNGSFIETLSDGSVEISTKIQNLRSEGIGVSIDNSGSTSIDVVFESATGGTGVSITQAKEVKILSGTLFQGLDTQVKCGSFIQPDEGKTSFLIESDVSIEEDCLFLGSYTKSKGIEFTGESFTNDNMIVFNGEIGEDSIGIEINNPLANVILNDVRFDDTIYGIGIEITSASSVDISGNGLISNISNSTGVNIKNTEISLINVQTTFFVTNGGRGIYIGNENCEVIIGSVFDLNDELSIAIDIDYIRKFSTLAGTNFSGLGDHIVFNNELNCNVTEGFGIKIAGGSPTIIGDIILGNIESSSIGIIVNAVDEISNTPTFKGEIVMKNIMSDCIGLMIDSPYSNQNLLDLKVERVYPNATIVLVNSLEEGYVFFEANELLEDSIGAWMKNGNLEVGGNVLAETTPGLFAYLEDGTLQLIDYNNMNTIFENTAIKVEGGSLFSSILNISTQSGAVGIEIVKADTVHLSNLFDHKGKDIICGDFTGLGYGLVIENGAEIYGDCTFETLNSTGITFSNEESTCTVQFFGKVSFSEIVDAPGIVMNNSLVTITFNEIEVGSVSGNNGLVGNFYGINDLYIEKLYVNSSSANGIYVGQGNNVTIDDFIIDSLSGTFAAKIEKTEFVKLGGSINLEGSANGLEIVDFNRYETEVQLEIDCTCETTSQICFQSDSLLGLRIGPGFNATGCVAVKGTSFGDVEKDGHISLKIEADVETSEDFTFGKITGDGSYGIYLDDGVRFSLNTLVMNGVDGGTGVYVGKDSVLAMSNGLFNNLFNGTGVYMAGNVLVSTFLEVIGDVHGTFFDLQSNTSLDVTVMFQNLYGTGIKCTDCERISIGVLFLPGIFILKGNESVGIKFNSPQCEAEINVIFEAEAMSEFIVIERIKRLTVTDQTKFDQVGKDIICGRFSGNDAGIVIQSNATVYEECIFENVGAGVSVDVDATDIVVVFKGKQTFSDISGGTGIHSRGNVVFEDDVFFEKVGENSSAVQINDNSCVFKKVVFQNLTQNSFGFEIYNADKIEITELEANVMGDDSNCIFFYAKNVNSIDLHKADVDSVDCNVFYMEDIMQAAVFENVNITRGDGDIVVFETDSVERLIVRDSEINLEKGCPIKIDTGDLEMENVLIGSDSCNRIELYNSVYNLKLSNVNFRGNGSLNDISCSGTTEYLENSPVVDLKRLRRDDGIVKIDKLFVIIDHENVTGIEIGECDPMSVSLINVKAVESGSMGVNVVDSQVEIGMMEIGKVMGSGIKTINTGLNVTQYVKTEGAGDSGVIFDLNGNGVLYSTSIFNVSEDSVGVKVDGYFEFFSLEIDNAFDNSVIMEVNGIAKVYNMTVNGDLENVGFDMTNRSSSASIEIDKFSINGENNGNLFTVTSEEGCVKSITLSEGKFTGKVAHLFESSGLMNIEITDSSFLQENSDNVIFSESNANIMIDGCEWNQIGDMPGIQLDISSSGNLVFSNNKLNRTALPKGPKYSIPSFIYSDGGCGVEFSNNYVDLEISLVPTDVYIAENFLYFDGLLSVNKSFSIEGNEFIPDCPDCRSRIGGTLFNVFYSESGEYVFYNNNIFGCESLTSDYCPPCELVDHCNDHGTCALVQNECVCEDNWVSGDCSVCNMTNNLPGTCKNGSCVDDWKEDCSVCEVVHREDDSECLEGVCADDWYGDLCNSCDVVNPKGDDDCIKGSCSDSWEGNLCNECSVVHGRVENTCVDGDCSGEWVGAKCDTCAVVHRKDNSSCNAWQCSEEWDGYLCNECSVVNRLDEDHCISGECSDSYTGDDCNECSVVHVRVENTCVEGDCGEDWEGDNCNTCSVVNRHNENSCVMGNCSDRWAGTYCNLCPIEHALKGTCRDNSCEDGYYGDDCILFKCYDIRSDNESVCGGHGECLFSGLCECESRWSGNDDCTVSSLTFAETTAGMLTMVAGVAVPFIALIIALIIVVILVVILCLRKKKENGNEKELTDVVVSREQTTTETEVVIFDRSSFSEKIATTKEKKTEKTETKTGESETKKQEPKKEEKKKEEPKKEEPKKEEKKKEKPKKEEPKKEKPKKEEPKKEEPKKEEPKKEKPKKEKPKKEEPKKEEPKKEKPKKEEPKKEEPKKEEKEKKDDKPKVDGKQDLSKPPKPKGDEKNVKKIDKPEVELKHTREMNKSIAEEILKLKMSVGVGEKEDKEDTDTDTDTDTGDDNSEGTDGSEGSDTDGSGEDSDTDSSEDEKKEE